MKITAIKTKRFLPPKDNLEDLLTKILLLLKEKTIVVITSKVISIIEGRCIPLTKIKKEDLIIQEAEWYLERKYVPSSLTTHTLKHNLQIRAAGIDESNANGYYILWPQNPQKTAKKIWRYLKRKSSIKEFGVIITDSTSIPLRRGAIGISLGYFGFEPLKDYRGEKDLFERDFTVSVANYADSLASAAVVVMGEGSEQTPIALISNLPSGIHFIDHPFKPKNKDLTFSIPIEEDIFAPFLTAVPWKKGGKQNK